MPAIARVFGVLSPSLPGEPRGDRRVVGGGAGERAASERFAQRLRRRAAIGVHLGEHGGVVGRIDHDRDAIVVLGRGADHGRAADVDILDAGVEIGAARDRLLERIEIDGEQVDRRDGVIGERLLMRLVPAHGEKPAMNFRMQRLDPPVHHLGHARDLGDVGHRDAGVAQQLGGPGRNDLDPVFPQGREIGKTGLVADREQRTGNLPLS